MALAESLKIQILANPTKRDSVLNAIFTFDKDSIKTRILLDISYNFYSKKDSLSFRYWNKVAQKHSHEIKDTSAVAETYWDLANFYYKEKILDSSYHYYNKALELYDYINDDYQAARMLINLATIQRDIKDFKNSEITTIEALKKLQPLDKQYQKYLAYNNLGVTNNHLEEYSEAIKFHNRALVIAENLDDEILIALTLNNIGVVYKNLGEYIKAIENYSKAKAIDSLAIKYPELEAMVMDNLAYSRFRLNDTLGIEKNFLSALALRERISHFSGIATSHLHLGDYYLSTSDTLKAINHYLESRKVSTSKGLNQEFLQSTLALAKLGGNGSSIFYNDYIDKATEFQREERAIKNRFAKIRFQTDEYIAETKRLTEQKIWIALVSLLTIMSLILLNYVRLQRTKNKDLAHEREQRIANEEIYKLILKQQSKLEEGRQQERKRISSDLHDGILGKLFGARLRFEFLNLEMSPNELKKFQSLTTELQEIEKEVREISHDLVSADFLYNSSFINLIDDLIHKKNAVGNICFHLDHDKSIKWENVNQEIQLDLYRIVQEAMQNIIKHADAKEVRITIHEENSKLLLTIRDNGRGFQKDKIRNGIGLINAESRVKKWNGYFSINSSLGHGTELTVEIPLLNI